MIYFILKVYSVDSVPDFPSCEICPVQTTSLLQHQVKIEILRFWYKLLQPDGDGPGVIWSL